MTRSIPICALCLLTFLAFGACTAPVVPTPEPVAVDGVNSAETATYPPSATRFQVVPIDSNVRYVVQETFFDNVSAIINANPQTGTFTTIGTTRAISGEIALDLSTDPPSILGGTFHVDLVTLRSGYERRDERIRVDWLESYRYPTATFTIRDAQFTAPSAANAPQQFALSGDLTLRSVTVPVTLNASATLQDNVIDANATAQLRMSQFNMEPPSMAGIVEVEDEFELRVRIRAIAR